MIEKRYNAKGDSDELCECVYNVDRIGVNTKDGAAVASVGKGRDAISGVGETARWRFGHGGCWQMLADEMKRTVFGPVATAEEIVSGGLTDRCVAVQ